MTLAAFDFLTAVVTALPPFCTVLTDWLSMMARVGSGLRPACTRTRRRSSCMTCSHMPRLRQRQNVMYTTSHGGKSLGNSRHWQPVRCTYRIALQMARRECLRGRPFCWGSSKGAKIAHSSSRKSLAYPMPFLFIHQEWAPCINFVNKLLVVVVLHGQFSTLFFRGPELRRDEGVGGQAVGCDGGSDP